MIFFLLLALAGPACAETGFLAQQAQLAWQDRDKPGQTEQAIQLWRQAVKAEPNRGDLWIDLTKALGRAVRHAKTKDEARRYAEEARDAGKKAVALSPSNTEAYTVYGEALGQWANTHKGVGSLKVVRQAVGALEKAVALDPKNGTAHMLLASFYGRAPAVISVGDKEKALCHAELAVSCGNTYAINHLVLAQSYLAKDRKDDAVRELQIVLSLSPPPDAIPETLSDQQTARDMLKSLGVSETAASSQSNAAGQQACSETAGACSEKP